MTDYSSGKIYKIMPICEHDEGDIYIGSTKRTLDDRMKSHKTKSDGCKSKFLFSKYGIDNCQIFLIENFACSTKSELLKREGEHQRTTKCLNTKIAGQTRQERLVHHPELIDIKKSYTIAYREDHRDELNEKWRAYYDEHREERIKKSRQYAIDNADHVKAYQQAYRDAHKEKTKAYNLAYRAKK